MSGGRRRGEVAGGRSPNNIIEVIFISINDVYCVSIESSLALT